MKELSDLLKGDIALQESSKSLQLEFADESPENIWLAYSTISPVNLGPFFSRVYYFGVKNLGDYPYFSFAIPDVCGGENFHFLISASYGSLSNALERMGLPVTLADTVSKTGKKKLAPIPFILVHRGKRTFDKVDEKTGEVSKVYFQDFNSIFVATAFGVEGKTVSK